MQTKVFVGSLPQGSKPEELRKLFERFGVVTECDIMNRCGFVHMQTEDQAAAAIQSLHNSTFNGGVITVEPGRIKERGQRGGGRGGGMRGGMRGSMDRRGGMRGGPLRDAPYPSMRDRGMGPMRGPMGGGMSMRNGSAPYDRSMERAPMAGGGYDDRYNGYGGEDRRGFALMDGRSAPRDQYSASRDQYSAPRDQYSTPRDQYSAPRDQYSVPRDQYSAPRDQYSAPRDQYSAPRDQYSAPRDQYSAPRDQYSAPRDQYSAPPPMYTDTRRGYSAPVDDMSAMYPDDRRAPVYPDERDLMDRRAPSGYDRAPRAAPIGNGDMYNRRTSPSMQRPIPVATGGYNQDPYAEQYPPMGRGGGAARHY